MFVAATTWEVGLEYRPLATVVAPPTWVIVSLCVVISFARLLSIVAWQAWFVPTSCS